MAIEKMSLINIVGNMTDLDKTLLRCLQWGFFHPEMAIHSAEPSHGFKLLEGENPYAAPLNNVLRLCSELKLKPEKTDFHPDELDLPKITAFLSSISESVTSLAEKERAVKESISQHEQAIIQLKHLAGLNTSFDDIFASEYVKVRFGRLPYDSYAKLAYYDNKTFFFFPFDHNKEYYWGVYFAPANKIAVIDDIFSSLYFERVRIPDYAHGTPEKATANILAIMEQERESLEEITKQQSALCEENRQTLLWCYSLLKFANATFDLRKYVATINNRFYMIGFVPKADQEKFAALFDDVASVDVVAKPYDADPSLTPPVKLKNNRLTRPFEQFVGMYSLPSYKDIDPTSFMAITYTLLFGIMFGDLGQGLVLVILGIVLSKWKKMNFGRILIRLGCSSAVFGTLYGSVFGFEEALNGFYQTVFGLESKPIEVFDTNTTNMLLLAAIAIGFALICISIIINIYLGFRSKDYERAIFGNNGIAGLVFYAAAAFAVLDMMALNTGIVTLPYILCLIVLPLLVIFFRGPLTKLIQRRKDVFEQGIGEFILENFFECFEYVLSYLSNSMSFLRVGGFILSHAGMMAVVMSLSEMVGTVGSPFVVVLGNLFVMGLEGLIAGIQVLRLEFYELFSRNFEGNGKPFAPAVVDYSVEE